ncbi:hypothetical protein D3C75_557180 [compost metagenome]
MYWLPVILLLLIVFGIEIYTNKNFIKAVIIVAVATLLTGITVAIDYSVKTTDTEVWSGYVDNWRHNEEYDEWIPESCTTTTDSQGRSSTSCTPGYYQHHDAENYIHTTDGGWITVYNSPDGKVGFNDSWPNRKSELQDMWPEGIPSSSAHSYVNKVQASYSIYKHKDIDVKDYPDLPDYPKKVKNYIYVDRIIGDVPNKEAALKQLNMKNTWLNMSIPNPEKPGKTMSWKQVNLIFVNVGIDKPQEYGFALQDHWGGGNKNDFVVSFSTDSNGDFLWTYAFSWSEVELLKLEVQDYIMGLQKISDFVPVVDEVSQKLADQFVRKQFADFNYLQIELSTIATILIWVFNLIGLAVSIFTAIQENEVKSRRAQRTQRYRSRY